MKCENSHLRVWRILLAAGLAGTVLAADPLSISKGLFTRNYTGQRNDFSGQVGFELVPAVAISVTALGRSVSGGAIRRPHAVTLWDCATEQPLARVLVSAASGKDEQGFACEPLARPLQLVKGRSYRLTSGEERGGDPMMDIGDIRAHLAVADVGPGVFSTGDGFPQQNFGGDEQGHGVPTIHFDTAGLAPALLNAGPRPPEPMLRDIRTGYLMNCAFRAIRPYSWKQNPRLSGWETDQSGGGWEEKPSGFFPDEFAFHVESFRLRDTSDQRAVTIRHQIARQTDGLVTWEFRFMLPTAMEGAAWQLRDTAEPAVSIITSDGKLCYESAGGAVALAPVVAGREYGIKVVADVLARYAEILVDGEVKAKSVPFARPVKSLDYVLIKTGDAATGEMLLPMVNVHRGYAVCETFATCGAGRAPDDWEINRHGGAATVEPFACAAKPDAASLKLTGGAAATKRFDTAAGRTVWEFKFLVPEKTDGAAAELLAGGRPALRIVTAGGDLCYVNPRGRPVPLVKDYRSNLWYSIKSVADCQTGAAEVFVNGKPAQAAVSFPPAAAAGFDGARFGLAGPGTMWIDDVRVYPWRDYPADYVTEPAPVAVRGGKLLGAQSCSLWKEGDAYAIREMKAMGIDCCYAYTWSTGDTAIQQKNLLAQRDAAAQAGFAMIPSVSVGWQTSPWDGNPEGNGWAPVPAYKALAQWTKDEFMPSLPESSPGRDIVLLPNWNEFGEGHFIMPSALAGFGYVDALREVFTSGGPHDDHVPTAVQQRRFTILYPKE